MFFILILNFQNENEICPSIQGQDEFYLQPDVVPNVSKSLTGSVLISAEASPSSDAWQTLQGASEDHKAFLEDLLVNYSCTCFTKSSDAA